MNLGELTTLKLISHLNWLAQVILEPEPEAVEDAAMVFSGPQFFTALITGVVLAFAFQMLLTNLGVATGISLLGGSSSSSNHHHDHHHDHSHNPLKSAGKTIRKIGLALGLGTLISVTISLFFACLFAVKLSLFVSPGSGAIVGLVIWGAYFSLLVWVSSTTVGSLVGSVVNSATSGFQALFGTAVAALGSRAASQQVVATAEATAAAVRRELTEGFDPVYLREKVEDYFDGLRPPQLDLKNIRSDFEDILRDPQLQTALASGDLSHVNRQTFVDLVSSRTDLSQQEVDRIARQLEAAWHKASSQLPSGDNFSKFVDFLKSAPRKSLLGNNLSDKLDALLEEMRKRRHAQNPSPVSQGLTMGFNSLAGLVMGRTDLSDLDTEKIMGQLQQLKDYLGEQPDKVKAQLSGTRQPYNPLRADIENYLLNAHLWQLKSINLHQEFRDLLYDTEADPGQVAEQLEQINRTDFADWLQQKGLLSQHEIDHISHTLNGIRLEVLNTAIAAKEREEAISLLAEVEQYLLTTPREELTPEKIQLNFRPILKDPDADFEHLSNRLAQLDRLTFERILLHRPELTPVEVAAITTELEITRDQVLQEARELDNAAQAKAEKQWLKLQSHLRDTGKSELNPQAIERELKLLLDDPQAGMSALRARASRFDRDTLVKLLGQRNDLSEEQVNRILDRVERNWTRITYKPKQLTAKAQQQYEQAKSAIADYLYRTGKPELNPDGIQRDLAQLLEDPTVGSRAIRRRLAEMDRDTLVQLLAQRDDLSEDQVNQVIDEVQNTLQTIAKSPRRLARRTQQKVQDFQSAFTDYLRSTDKSELNPDGIQRDLKLLLNDPRLGMESLQDRLSQFDRSTFVALLSQRDDISEQEANRIVDNIFSVRDRFLDQLQAIQTQVQLVLDRIFARIRAYLNSLDRPELNYEGIRNDFRTLFDDPQAGFEALRERLSQFDRDTLVALMSSRKDISEADANRIIDQVEMTRNRVLQKAERLQKEAEMRLEQVKHQTQKQLEETQKAAAAAAWWLFVTALVSGLAAAGAGALGVTT
ncbi:MAG: MFS transporter [Lyngbya sp.]|nr:MFS transporter [Lyngbya sp.]